jgi:hypothetical protein
MCQFYKNVGKPTQYGKIAQPYNAATFVKVLSNPAKVAMVSSRPTLFCCDVTGKYFILGTKHIIFR